MKFIIDNKIPYIKGVLEPFGKVLYLAGKDTTPEIVKDADAIITRTRTKCTESLLKGSTVRFIATATIGFDHIDTYYCKKANIKWTNAPGCNSKSVEQYIASTLFVLSEKKNFSLKGKTIGIVGVGQVGSKVASICSLFGMKVLLNDPPRSRKEGDENFVSLDVIKKESDFITLHVPLNKEGIDKTYHMADQNFFNNLGKCPVIINACRGEVMDNMEAKSALKNKLVSGMVIDCWENEPGIDRELISLCDIVTPHIAGYSKDGKANGTSMSIQSVSRFFGLGIDNWRAINIPLPSKTKIKIDGSGLSEEEILKRIILFTYDIREDDKRLRTDPSQFEKLRGDYPVRREFPVYSVYPKNISEDTIEKIKTLGFKIIKQK